MSRCVALALAVLVAAHWAGFARADVTVSFTDPERYTDISRHPAESETDLREIGDH